MKVNIQDSELKMLQDCYKIHGISEFPQVETFWGQHLIDEDDYRMLLHVWETAPGWDF